MTRPPKKDSYSEFDELLSELHETAESELAKRERRPNASAYDVVDPEGFIVEWPDLTGRLIEERMPALDRGDGIRFLLQANALLIGLAAMAFPSPVIDQVFESDRKLRPLRIDLHREFLEGVTALLNGMEKRT